MQHLRGRPWREAADLIQWNDLNGIDALAISRDVVTDGSAAAARVFEFDDLCGAAIGGGEPVLHFLGDGRGRALAELPVGFSHVGAVTSGRL